MVKKSLLRRSLASFVSLCLLLSTYGLASAQVSGSDIKGHWAETQISAWVNNGWISGYEDGSFRPNRSITRAEFSALVNRTFAFMELGDVSFKDLSATNWAYSDIRKAVKAGYITGYEDGTVRAANPISRQEAAVILVNIMGLTGDESGASVFADASLFPAWSRGAIGKAAIEQFISGYEDGTFRAARSITRAEAVTMLDRALNVRTTIFGVAGTYGPATGLQTINGNVQIAAHGVTLQNTVINGNLLLRDTIGNGDVTLKNVTVKGGTTVSGGGANSIHITDSTLAGVIVNKSGGNVRIVAEGNSSVGTVNLQSGAILESQTTGGTGFNEVILTGDIPANSTVTLIGSFDKVTVQADSIKIEVPQGTIGELTVESGAAGVDLNLGANARINDLTLNSAVDVTGQGTIDNAVISAGAAGSTFEKPPVKTEGPGAPTTPPPTNGGGNPGTGNPGNENPGTNPGTVNPPSLSDIQVTNYASGPDEVRVNSLNAGVTVRVYGSQSGNDELSSAVSATVSGVTYAKVLIPGGFGVTDHVYVSVTNPNGQNQSVRVAAAVPAIPTAPVAEQVYVSSTGSVTDHVYVQNVPSNGRVVIYKDADTRIPISTAQNSGNAAGSVTVNAYLEDLDTVYVAISVNNGESDRVAVSVPPLRHSVTNNVYAFNSLAGGYGSGTQGTLTVTVKGIDAQTNVEALLSGPDAGSFTIAENITDLNDGATGTFTVRPKDGLPAGTYTATVTIRSNQFSGGVSFTVTQVVT